MFEVQMYSSSRGLRVKCSHFLEGECGYAWTHLELRKDLCFVLYSEIKSGEGILLSWHRLKEQDAKYIATR